MLNNAGGGMLGKGRSKCTTLRRHQIAPKTFKLRPSENSG
jgi:hypothetical protein